ncbi:hypothetical protein SDJN03_04579, partial [Cucurbita argyrosperma subsp. sororia]
MNGSGSMRRRRERRRSDERRAVAVADIRGTRTLLSQRPRHADDGHARSFSERNVSICSNPASREILRQFSKISFGSSCMKTGEGPFYGGGG